VVTELKILRWCDACRAGEEYMPAEEVPVRLGDGARAIDLCEPHYKEFVAPLVRLLEEVGHPPDVPPPPGRPAAATRPASGGPLLPRDRSVKHKCLVCGMDTKAMSQHLRARHGLSMEAVYGTTCPFCAGDAKSISGVGTHLTKTHRIRGVADAFTKADAEGDKLGIVAGRRRVVAKLASPALDVFAESP